MSMIDGSWSVVAKDRYLKPVFEDDWISDHNKEYVVTVKNLE